MPEFVRDLLLLALSAVLNGGVTYGVVKTQLAWLRRDVDELREHVFSPAGPVNRRGVNHGQEA